MTEQEFTELAEKHLTALQSYKMDKNGNFPIEIFGIEKLYKQLTLTDVSESCKINGKGLCGYSNKLGLCPRCDTDAYSR